MKCWELANDKPEKNWLNFGSDPDNIVDIVSLQVGRKCCHLTTAGDRVERGHCACLWLYTISPTCTHLPLADNDNDK